MTIVADRGLFVRLPVQSGKFEHAQAEALVDTIDATTKEPASKADLDVAVARLNGDLVEVRGEIARLDQRVNLFEKRLYQRIDQVEKRLDQQIAASANSVIVKLGGLMIALVGLLFAALRLT